MMLGSGKVMVVVAILKIRPEMVIWRLTGYMLLTFGLKMLARDLLHESVNLCLNRMFRRKKQMFLMKTRQPRLLLWCLGFWTGMALLLPLQPCRRRRPGTCRPPVGSGLVEQARDRYNPVQPVNLKGTPEEAEFDFTVESQRFTKPLVTGPLALVLNLSAGIRIRKAPRIFNFGSRACQ